MSRVNARECWELEFWLTGDVQAHICGQQMSQETA